MTEEERNAAMEELVLGINVKKVMIERHWDELDQEIYFNIAFDEGSVSVMLSEAKILLEELPKMMDMKKVEKQIQAREEETMNPSPYMDAITSRFSPAKSEVGTTHWFSTAEVVDAIRQLNPSFSLSQEQMFALLWDAGFRFGNRPGSQGLQFLWMMHEKESV